MTSTVRLSNTKYLPPCYCEKGTVGYENCYHKNTRSFGAMCPADESTGPTEQDPLVNKSIVKKRITVPVPVPTPVYGPHGGPHYGPPTGYPRMPHPIVLMESDAGCMRHYGHLGRNVIAYR